MKFGAFTASDQDSQQISKTFAVLSLNGILNQPSQRSNNSISKSGVQKRSLRPLLVPLNAGSAQLVDKAKITRPWETADLPSRKRMQLKIMSMCIPQKRLPPIQSSKIDSNERQDCKAIAITRDLNSPAYATLQGEQSRPLFEVVMLYRFLFLIRCLVGKWWMRADELQAERLLLCPRPWLTSKTSVGKRMAHRTLLKQSAIFVRKAAERIVVVTTHN